jgi:transcriptional regulator with XRE-family HTH domain
MKLDYPKSWFEHQITLEGEAEVGAGIPPAPAPTPHRAANVVPLDTRIAFGTFVGLWRRNQGWDAEKLAEQAGIDPEEVLEIEHDPHHQPELDAVHKLARVFGVSAKALLELAGLTEARTPHLREEAVRFAARSESIAALSQREREALEAFVSAISEARSP